MFDCCIFILLFNAFCQRNNLYLSFLTLILRWKTRDVCSGSRALKEWNTEISVTPSGILWRVKLDFEVLFIYLFLSISQTYGVSWGKVALKGMGTSMCGGQRVILQDSCGDQRDVPVELELLHFSHFSIQGHGEMTTSCRHPRDK